MSSTRKGAHRKHKDKPVLSRFPNPFQGPAPISKFRATGSSPRVHWEPLKKAESWPGPCCLLGQFPETVKHSCLQGSLSCAYAEAMPEHTAHFPRPTVPDLRGGWPLGWWGVRGQGGQGLVSGGSWAAYRAKV